MKKVNEVKLQELRDLACHLNSELLQDPEYGNDIQQRGGIPLLGNHYGVSRKLFFGINPGIIKHEEGKSHFCVDVISKNGPWQIDEITGKTVKPEFSYWRNCAYFFSSNHHLYEWINDATSAFLVPWQTANVQELKRHPLYMQIKDYSRQIVSLIIKHHDPKAIIIVGSGRGNREFAMELLNISSSYKPITSGNYYQWGKAYKHTTQIFFIPHFSRANNKERLKECAAWLSQEVSCL